MICGQIPTAHRSSVIYFVLNKEGNFYSEECSIPSFICSDINVVAVDTDGEVMEAIQNGTNLVATVSQDPYTMGYKALENAVKYLDGEKVEDIAIECELVTADNRNAATN